MNGGKCILTLSNTFVCACTQTFTGKLYDLLIKFFYSNNHYNIINFSCDELVNFCASSPCPTNYYCANSAQGYACYPSTIISSVCSSNPCLNDGVCETTNNIAYTCKCKFGYVGN